MPFLSSILAVAGAAQCLLTSEAEISSVNRTLRLRDLVALNCMNEAERAAVGDTIVLQAPAQRDEIRLSRRALANLVHRRIPALEELGAEEPDEIVTLRFNTRPRAHVAAPAQDHSGAPASVKFGDALTLQVSIGPVIVERAVTAMQSAEFGGDVFVRGESGEVFALPVSSLRSSESAQ